MARVDSVGMFWDDTPPPKPEKKKVEKRVAPEKFWLKEDYLPYLKEAIDFNLPLLSDNELYQAISRKDQFAFDIECYPNYFLIAFKHIESGKIIYFESIDNSECADIPKLLNLINSCLLISFNGNNYDIPILSCFLKGYSTQELKELSDEIILGQEPSFSILKKKKVNRVKCDHIDLIEVAPLKSNLKIYGGRVHTRKMQDLPYPPETVLTNSQIAVVRYYCCNDLQVTADLKKALDKRLDLRVAMSNEYKIDLRSKSDAQIAEAVIREEIERLTGDKIHIPVIPKGTTYRYITPPYIRPRTKVLVDALNVIQNTNFVVSDRGNISMPEEIKGLKIPIGNSVYRFGIGGLHSSEKQAIHYNDGKHRVFDFDVTSYYPFIILTLGLYPKHLTSIFLKVYKGIVDRRVHAKKIGDKVTQETLKIVINGSFGKFGSKYSALYSPNLLIQVTLTGQLSLLILIEALEMSGIPVVSANTDGIVAVPSNDKMDILNSIMEWWQKITNFNLERTEYKAIVSRDVNNYIAIKTDGSVKLSKGIPVDKTIRECRDIKKFLTVRAVKGGAVKDNTYLGKSIRWYYAENVSGYIIYALNGNKVPNSDGAKPLMELPDSFPDDIDYDKYIQESLSILKDVGFQ